jgi:hypothetical protein
MSPRAAARNVLRRVLPALSRRRWLVKLATPVFFLAPSIKARLQRIAAAQPVVAPVRKIVLNDAQLRVLLDLRDALPPADR